MAKVYLMIIFSWFSFFCFSQKEKGHESFYYYLKRKEFDKAKEKLIDNNFKTTLIKLSDILESEGQIYDYDNFKIEYDLKDDLYLQALKKLVVAYTSIFYNEYEKFDTTKELLITSLDISEKIKHDQLTKQILLAVFKLYRKDLKQIDDDYIYFLKKFKLLLKDDVDYAYYIINYFVFQSKSNSEIDSLFHNTVIKLDSIFKIINSTSKLQPYYYFEKGIYNSILGNNGKAQEEYQRVLSLTSKKPFYRYINYGSYLKLSEIYNNNHQFSKAFTFLNKTKDYEDITDTLFISKYHYYLYGSKYYRSINKLDSAYTFLLKANKIENKINPLKNKLERSATTIKYETEKKEKENLKLRADNLTSEAKRKQNQNLLFGALAILFFSGIIYYQNLKNSKRKRLLAEQQKELAKQKNITLLKEQEITTINAMVDGQEKERIRIAEDLHDNIGSVLATLKLHFENLKLNREKKHFNQEELYLKTEKLIDETYFKVRSIAHAKNAGVIANKGLLTAVKIMAEKISDANKIAIEVLDFGLEKRLENSLELTVFRIIQELTTNIIKHAAATNASINLSLYDNNLNIIIEDNGKGFTLKENELKNDGMGLGSIKTRVKHLNGTFEVDSTINKGASILINIPV